MLTHSGLFLPFVVVVTHNSLFSWTRDLSRLQDAQKRMNECPLGSGALSGHPFKINREVLAEKLEFDGVTGNSMDSVSDRDFILEFLSYASIAGMHLSRFAEDLIVYSSAEFGFLKCSDAYSTGSSLMPQKKNPDALELLRGKSGTGIGLFVKLSTVMKGLPLTYNKDMQEDKEALFEAVDTMHATLAIARGVLSTLDTNAEKMRSALSADMLATDLADYLVRKGVPFRETHHVAGECVNVAEKGKKSLSELTLEEFKSIHPKFSEDVLKIFDFHQSVEKRDATGGTSKRAVMDQISKLKAISKIEKKVKKH